MNTKHLYGAVALLLVGFTAITWPQRKAAHYFNVCVETHGNYDKLSADAIKGSVHFCNGR